MSKFITLDNLKSALTKFKENLSPSLTKLDSITGVVTADKLQNPDHPTDLVAYEAFQAAVPLVQGMNLMGATVGQTIKVKAVNEQGMPTAWEAAEEKTLKWIKVHESTLTENTNIISVGADESGKELQEYNPIGIALVVSTPADATQTNNNGQVWAYPQKDMGDNAIRIISTIAAWKTVNRDSIWIWQGGSTALAYNGNNNGASPAYKVNNYAMNGVYAYIPDTKDHFPVGSTVLVSVLTEM